MPSGDLTRPSCGDLSLLRCFNGLAGVCITAVPAGKALLGCREMAMSQRGCLASDPSSTGALCCTHMNLGQWSGTVLMSINYTPTQNSEQCQGYSGQY